MPAKNNSDFIVKQNTIYISTKKREILRYKSNKIYTQYFVVKNYKTDERN